MSMRDIPLLQSADVARKAPAQKGETLSSRGISGRTNFDHRPMLTIPRMRNPMKYSITSPVIKQSAIYFMPPGELQQIESLQDRRFADRSTTPLNQETRLRMCAFQYSMSLFLLFTPTEKPRWVSSGFRSCVAAQSSWPLHNPISG